MRYPNDVKHLLTVLIVLFIAFVSYVIWWGVQSTNKQEALKEDVVGLSVALEEAHLDDPGNVPTPEEVIEDPPEVFHGRDGRDGENGRDGRDGRPPTASEIAAATEDWLMNNISNQPDPDDPELQDLEIQDVELQDEETQDAEIQDAEINDPDPDDPETQDPEINDPDPGMASFEFIFEFANKTFTVTCTDPDGDLAYSCVAVET